LTPVAVYRTLPHSASLAHLMHTRLKTKQSVPIWRKEDRTGHIYRVAAEIMCQKGYEATSMNDIADAVGLTKAGVYHYIRGKEDLLFQIMSFGMDMVDEDVIGPARNIADAETRLRTILERHSRRIMEQGGAVTILLEEMSALTPAHQRLIRNRKRKYFELFRDTLEELAAEGKLRELDPTVASFSIVGMLMWTSRWYRRGGRLTPQQATAHLVEMATNAVLGARPSSGKRAESEKNGVRRPDTVRKRAATARLSGIEIPIRK
jgi:TetR/AcrR family transcriptional regulator, cholesterol catabolism regulator